MCQRLALLDYLRTHCLPLLQRSLSIKVADKLIIPQGHLLGAVWQQSDSIANRYCINWLSWPILTLSKYIEIKIKAQNMVNQNRTRFNHVWPFLLYKCLNKQLKETKGFAYKVRQFVVTFGCTDQLSRRKGLPLLMGSRDKECWCVCESFGPNRCSISPEECSTYSHLGLRLPWYWTQSTGMTWLPNWGNPAYSKWQRCKKLQWEATRCNDLKKDKKLLKKQKQTGKWLRKRLK